jgi:hypothetical protein
MNSVWFNVEHYHNTHSTRYRCTHYTLLSTAWCFQSVCNSVTPWCVILFSTNSSTLVHPPVHIPPRTAPEPTPPPPQGLFRTMRTVHRTTQQTNIYAPSGIRTRDPSNQAVVDLRLSAATGIGADVAIQIFKRLATCTPRLSIELMSVNRRNTRDREIVLSVKFHLEKYQT